MPLVHGQRSQRYGRRRSGAAAVELAVLLPLLGLLTLGAFDFGRVFAYSIIVTNCARNGALWQSDPFSSTQSRYSTLSQAAAADAPASIQRIFGLVE